MTSFTMTTPGADRVSDKVKSRPRVSGLRIVSKYDGEIDATNVVTRSSSDSAPGRTISCCA